MWPGAICARHRQRDQIIDVLQANQAPKECLSEARPSQARLDELAQRASQQLPLFPSAEAMPIANLSFAGPALTIGRSTEPCFGQW
jgi:hypothetical protein